MPLDSLTESKGYAIVLAWVAGQLGLPLNAEVASEGRLANDAGLSRLTIRRVRGPPLIRITEVAENHLLLWQQF